MKTLKAFFGIEGDSSVGIPDTCGSFECNLIISDKKEREQYRQDLQKMFTEFFDEGPAGVWFDDECTDCGKILDKNGKCNNKKCQWHDWTETKRL